MRGALLAIFLILVCGLCSAQRMRFSPVTKAQVLERVGSAPSGDQERAAQLKTWFAEAGCNGDMLAEQPVPGAAAPNIICKLQGQGAGTIVVGAHFERASSPQRPLDNWSGASLLPSLYRALRERKRRHTIIFVAFADRGNDLTGAEFFASHLQPDEVKNLTAMINLDVLGLSPTKIWTAHSDKDLVQALVDMMYILKLPGSQIDIAAAGKTDSEPFASRRIPQITIHSLTQRNLEDGAASQFRAGNYYDTYRLVCGYLAYLDQTFRPRSHS